jgi:hypothetical protein
MCRGDEDATPKQLRTDRRPAPPPAKASHAHRRHTPAHRFLLRIAHRFPIDETTNIRPRLSQAASPAFLGGVRGSRARPPCGTRQPSAGPRCFSRLPSLRDLSPRAFRSKSAGVVRWPDSPLHVRDRLPSFAPSESVSKVRSISLKTTCLHSPLSRVLPRRPGPRPSAR